MIKGRIDVRVISPVSIRVRRIGVSVFDLPTAWSGTC